MRDHAVVQAKAGWGLDRDGDGGEGQKEQTQTRVRGEAKVSSGRLSSQKCCALSERRRFVALSASDSHSDEEIHRWE